MLIYKINSIKINAPLRCVAPKGRQRLFENADSLHRGFFISKSQNYGKNNCKTNCTGHQPMGY